MTEVVPGKIYPALVAIMRAIGPIAKSETNNSQKYNFRGVDAVYNACHPHLAEHGVFSTSCVVKATHTQVGTTTKGGDKTLNHAILHMRFTYWAEDGSSVSTEVVGEGMDYGGDKASNKAMSVADKYALLQLLKIPTATIDPDRTPHERPTTKAGAPSQKPRAERVPANAIKDLSKRYKKIFPDSTFPAWCEFVLKVTNRTDFNPRMPEEWELEDVTSVTIALDQEVLNDE